MSKSKLKKALALLLAVSMLATSFVACKSDDSDKDTDKDTNVTDDKDTDDDKDADDDAEPEEFTYPMTYDGEQVTFYANGFFDINDEFNTAEESQYHVLCEEHTGLDVKWDFCPSGTNVDTYYTLVISSSSFPTVISGTPIADTDVLKADGVIIDLQPVIEENAPNYYAFLNDPANEHIKKTLTTDSGVIGGFGAWREEAFGAVYQGLLIRQDLLDAQGLALPETIADWDNVMKVMHDEYGMQLSLKLTTHDTPFLASGFGAYGTYTLKSYVLDGEVKLAQSGDEWKNYMAKLNEWYDAGYLDADFITHDNDTLNARMYNDEVFAAPRNMSNVTLFQNYAADNNSSATWSACQWPVQNAGEVACTGFMQDVVRTQQVSISTSASDEQTVAALRFLDWFMTEEGSYFQNFGDEGTDPTDTHTRNEDGSIVWADYITEDPTGMRMAMIKYTGATGISIGAQLTDLVKSMNAAEASAAVDVWTSNTLAGDVLFPAGVSYTDDEQIELSNIEAPLRTYVNEMCIAFIQGTQDAETYYDTYMDELENTYQLSRYLEIQQAAYDRFLAR